MCRRCCLLLDGQMDGCLPWCCNWCACRGDGVGVVQDRHQALAKLGVSLEQEGPQRPGDQQVGRRRRLGADTRAGQHAPKDLEGPQGLCGLQQNSKYSALASSSGCVAAGTTCDNPPVVLHRQVQAQPYDAMCGVLTYPPTPHPHLALQRKEGTGKKRGPEDEQQGDDGAGGPSVPSANQQQQQQRQRKKPKEEQTTQLGQQQGDDANGGDDFGSDGLLLDGLDIDASDAPNPSGGHDGSGDGNSSSGGGGSDDDSRRSQPSDSRLQCPQQQTGVEPHSRTRHKVRCLWARGVCRPCLHFQPRAGGL